MKLKRLLASVLAGAFAFLAVPSISAGAISTYDPCDVNHSNTVDIMDVIVLARYLNGDLYVINTNLLDANRDQVVDSVDRDCVFAKVVHNSYSGCFVSRTYNQTTGVLTESDVAFPTINPYTISECTANQQTDGRQYRKINYSSRQISTYGLFPSTTGVASVGGDEIQSLPGGVDTRYSTTLSENTGIVCIETSYYNNTNHGSGVGTGFVIGDHLIACAAHTVEKIFSPAFNFSMTVTPHNEDGTIASSSVLHPVEIHVPYDYFNDNQPTGVCDYALIVVSEDLSDYVHFSVGTTYNLDASHFSGIPVYTTGNPGEVNGVTNADYDLYSGKGSILTAPNGSNTGLLLYHDIPATHGNSGGPIYTITKNTIAGETTYSYTALSLVHGEDGNATNFGTRFTKYHLQFFFNNSNIADVENMQ